MVVVYTFKKIRKMYIPKQRKVLLGSCIHGNHRGNMSNSLTPCPSDSLVGSVTSAPSLVRQTDVSGRRSGGVSCKVRDTIDKCV